MATNRYSPIVDVKNRYNPISPTEEKPLNVVKNSVQPTSGLNQTGQKAFYSNPYTSAPLPKSQAPKEVTISQPTQEKNSLNPINLVTDLAKGFYNQYANPSESTIQAEKMLGYTPTSKPKDTLEKVERVVSAPIRTIGKAFVRTFAPALEPAAQTFGQIAASSEINKKVIKGELPPEALDTLDALNKKWYQVVGDTSMAVLAAYTPSLTKNLFKGSVLSGMATGAETGLSFGAAQVLSSGETDPKKIAEIIIKSTVAGSVLGTATGYLGTLGAKFKTNSVKKVQALDAVDIINQYADTPITKSSSLEDIKAAYYSAANKTHPDKGGDPLTFSDVNKAYQFLTGKQKNFIKQSPETNQPVRGLLDSENIPQEQLATKEVVPSIKENQPIAAENIPRNVISKPDISLADTSKVQPEQQGIILTTRVSSLNNDQLLKEAKKYNTAKEFANKYKIEPTYDLTPGVTKISDTSLTGLYHGAGITNLKSILNDEKIKRNISNLDSIKEYTISASGNRSVADSYGVVLELDENISKRIAPSAAIKGDIFNGFEYRIDEDIPLNKIKSITIPLNKKEGLDTRILWDYSGKNTEYISAADLKKKFENKGIKVFFNDGTNLTESNLINIWNEANKGYLDTSKSIGELESQYRADKPGYRNLDRFIDTMIKNQTVLPEEGVILKTLFEGTDDRLLEMIKFYDNPRLSAVFGKFKIKRTGENPELEMQKGLARKGEAQAVRTFTHEFGHAGWYLVLNQNERNIVTDVYRQLSKEQRKQLFTHNQGYYAKNEKEFFAQSFSDYVMENKVPASQMKSLLRRVAEKFYQRIRNLIIRGEQKAVEIMKPLFEKILAGDKSTPLSEFASKEPPSFKMELQRMIDEIAPEVSTQQGKALFPQKTKEVQVEEMLPVEESPAVIDTPAGAADEIFQKATNSLPPDTPINIEPLEEIVQKGNTPFPKRVSIVDDLRTPWRVFDKIGIRPAYQTLLKSYEGYVTELPKNIDKITAWSKRVPAESNEKIFRYLDGEDVSLTAEESQVAKEIKNWLGQWADRLHMAPDERISEYITHIFPIDKKGVEIPEEIASLINNKMAKSVYNPFLLQRKGAEGYLKDTWRALDAYVKRATRKVNMDPALKAFEDASKTLTDVSQINYVEKFIARLNMRPTPTDLKLDNQIKSLVGYTFGARPINSMTRAMRQMIARAKIGGSLTSFAKNLTQGVNTFAELGTQYTLKGYFSLVKPGAAAEIKANNVTMGRFIEDRTYSAVKKAAEIADKVLFINMEASENVNRGAAYFGAKAKFLDGKITPREFREGLGREMPEGYVPNLQDAIDYGKFVAGKTQFRFDPLETPMALSSDIARTAFQFQTFGLKQAEFIISNLSYKNKWKLLRYIFSSIFIFETIGAAFGMKWQDSYKILRWGYPPIAQFIIDLYQGGISGTDKYGNVLNTDQKVKTVAKTLFTNVVPAGAQMQRTFEGLSAVESGKETTRSGKFKYKIAPTTENYISGALFGKYNLPESQTYYKNQADKKKGKKTTAPNSKRYNPI